MLVWGIRVRAPREKVNILQHRTNDPHTNKKSRPFKRIVGTKIQFKSKKIGKNTNKTHTIVLRVRSIMFMSQIVK